MRIGSRRGRDAGLLVVVEEEEEGVRGEGGCRRDQGDTGNLDRDESEVAQGTGCITTRVGFVHFMERTGYCHWKLQHRRENEAGEQTRAGYGRGVPVSVDCVCCGQGDCGGGPL